MTGEPPDLISTRTAPTRKHSARTRQERCRTKQQSWRLGRDDISELAATIAAQRGPQTEFLRSPADICIYGGAAGGGKTVGLILEPLRYATRVMNFTAVFFGARPRSIQSRRVVGREQKLLPPPGGDAACRNAGVALAACRQDQVLAPAVRQHRLRRQGAQITLICFDELTHFTAHHFFYMVSRNRSTCGVRP